MVGFLKTTLKVKYPKIINKIPTKTEPTAITEKMANGDVIKTMFPDAEIFYQRDAKVYRVHFDRFEYEMFRKDWWNAPYQGR